MISEGRLLYKKVWSVCMFIIMRCDLIRALPTVMWVCDCGQMKCWGSNFQTVTCTFETVNIVWNSSRSLCPSVSDFFLSSITLSSSPSCFICLSQGLLLLTGQLLRCLRSQSLRPPARLWPYLHVNRITAKVRTVAMPIQRSVRFGFALTSDRKAGENGWHHR